jgi:virginiamycin B lyase
MKPFAPFLAAFAVVCAGTCAAQAASDLPDGKGRDAVQRLCSGCHALSTVTSQRHTADEWGDIIARMVNHGLPATEDQQAEIQDYLARYYGPASPQAPKTGKPDAPARH